MLCKQCQTIFPNYYKECPNCKSLDFEREQDRKDLETIAKLLKERDSE